MALALGCLVEKWPWPWGACWGRCLEGLEGFGGFGGFGVWKVLEGLEGLEGFGWCLEGLERFGVFAGWQTAALKANRKPLLWPWPWGAWLRSGLGPGVPVGEGVWRVLEGVWRVWRILEGFGGFGVFAGWQTAALKANRKPLLWPWPWGA